MLRPRRPSIVALSLLAILLPLTACSSTESGGGGMASDSDALLTYHELGPEHTAIFNFTSTKAFSLLKTAATEAGFPLTASVMGSFDPTTGGGADIITETQEKVHVRFEPWGGALIFDRAEVIGTVENLTVVYTYRLVTNSPGYKGSTVRNISSHEEFFSMNQEKLEAYQAAPPVVLP